MPDLILLVLGDSTGMPERDSPNALRVTEESKDTAVSRIGGRSTPTDAGALSTRKNQKNRQTRLCPCHRSHFRLFVWKVHCAVGRSATENATSCIPIQASATIEHDWQFPTPDVSNGPSSHRSAS